MTTGFQCNQTNRWQFVEVSSRNISQIWFHEVNSFLGLYTGIERFGRCINTFMHERKFMLTRGVRRSYSSVCCHSATKWPGHGFLQILRYIWTAVLESAHTCFIVQQVTKKFSAFKRFQRLGATGNSKVISVISQGYPNLKLWYTLLQNSFSPKTNLYTCSRRIAWLFLTGWKS